MWKDDARGSHLASDRETFDLGNLGKPGIASERTTPRPRSFFFIRTPNRVNRVNWESRLNEPQPYTWLVRAKTSRRWLAMYGAHDRDAALYAAHFLYYNYCFASVDGLA